MTDGQVIEGEAVEVGAEVVHAPSGPPPASLFRTDDPAEVLKRATETANALAPVLSGQNMLSDIQGKKHVRIEGWTTLGSMLGVTAVGVWTKPTENGWEAKVNAQTLDGRVIGSAEAMCTRDEGRWKTADDYAIRSMAQTRAASKALASVLRFVVTLAGFSGTPAEEMDGVRSSGGTRKGFASDKQKGFLERLLREDHGWGDPEVIKAVDYLNANHTGERGGAIPRTIDALTTKASTADQNKALDWLSERGEAYAVETNTEAPAEPEPEGLSEEFPF